MGYVLPMSYCSVPWLAYFAFRIGRRFTDGLWLGFWLVVRGDERHPVHESLRRSADGGRSGVRALRMQPRGRRRAMILHTLAAIGVFLLICGWRLSTVLLVILDDKRERITYWDESPSTMLHYLLYRPGPNWTDDFNAAAGLDVRRATCYVGPLVLVLALLSLASGWRWWHTLTAVVLLAGDRLDAVVSAELLAHGLAVPGLGPRGHSLAIPGDARPGIRRRQRAGPVACVATQATPRSWRRPSRVIAADLVVLGHQQFPRAFSDRPSPDKFPGPPVPDIVNVRDGLGYPCTMRGYGVIRGGSFKPTGRIVAYGQAGDDDIQVAGAIRQQVWLYGDAGNDRLNAGNGGSLLIGGAGNDQLIGGGGRDVMIGGRAPTDSLAIVTTIFWWPALRRWTTARLPVTMRFGVPCLTNGLAVIPSGPEFKI